MFVYKDFYVGGCELLIEKLATQLKKDEDVLVLSHTIDDQMYDRYKKKSISVDCLDDWENLENYIADIKLDEELKIITFVWREFYPCYISKIENKKTIYYAVNNEAFTTDILRENEFKTISFEHVGSLVSKFVKDRHFIFMDNDMIEKTNDFYKGYFSCKEDDYEIVKIPIDCENVIAVNKKQIQNNIDNPHILTISRADFRMKGYLIGLVKWFSTTDIEISLDIVSYGPDIEKLKNLIHELPETKQKRIRLIGKMDYDELDSIIKSALIYVGMGTTLIDASLRGIVSIPVEAFVNELNVSGLFIDNYDYLGKRGNNKDFDTMVRNILGLPIDEYYRLSKTGVDIVLNNYASNKMAIHIKQLFSNIRTDIEGTDIRWIANS